jgi:hypothetical protein
MSLGIHTTHTNGLVSVCFTDRCATALVRLPGGRRNFSLSRFGLLRSINIPTSMKCGHRGVKKYLPRAQSCSGFLYAFVDELYVLVDSLVD